jgi:ubiquinone/menaquinone biosynthesis C-methylase UbiE
MPSPALTPLAAAALRVSPPPERVLEIETREGEGALFLAREFPAARVRGVDREESLVRAASERIGLDPEGRIAFKSGTPNALPYPDDFFDLVAQTRGRVAPGEIARVLRPGGTLVLVHDGPEAPGGFRGRRLRRRLARHGIAIETSKAAGDGSFSVARLGGGGSSPGAD